MPKWVAIYRASYAESCAMSDDDVTLDNVLDRCGAGPPVQGPDGGTRAAHHQRRHHGKGRGKTRVAVTVPGAVLSARVDGPADKSWLILSNALAANMGMWDDHMPLLPCRNRVVRYDARGHEGKYGVGGGLQL